MSTIERRDNGRWRARYRDPQGKQRNKSFARKVDAQRFLTTVEASKLTGSYVDPVRSRLTVGEWAAQWLDAQVQLKPSTLYRYDVLLNTQVLPTWGKVELARVTHAAVVKWVAALTASGYAPATVRQAYRVLSLVLALAVRDGRLVRNPADGARLPRAQRAEKRFLTHEQVAALADACGRYRLAVLILAYCGLRFGELVAMRAGRVDLMRRRLEVAESASEVGGRVMFGDPKTHQARSVPVPRFLAEALAEHLAGLHPDALVFTSPEGGVLRLQNFRRRYFDRAATAVGLDGLTPHELRHTAASLAVRSGANVKAVQRLLGHASAAMTLDVYAGLFEDDLDAVASRLDAAAREADVSKMCPGAHVVEMPRRGVSL